MGFDGHDAADSELLWLKKYSRQVKQSTRAAAEASVPQDSAEPIVVPPSLLHRVTERFMRMGMAESTARRKAKYFLDELKRDEIEEERKRKADQPK